MLNIKYVHGTADSLFELNPALLTGNALADAKNATIVSLVGGSLITVGSDGYVKLCDGASEVALGVLIDDAAGYDLENKPALASGKTPALAGGSVCITDMVVSTDIVAGNKLYCGKETEAGKLTKVDPTGNGSGQVVAIARSANSADDKSVLVTFMV